MYTFLLIICIDVLRIMHDPFYQLYHQKPYSNKIFHIVIRMYVAGCQLKKTDDAGQT